MEVSTFVYGRDRGGQDWLGGRPFDRPLDPEPATEPVEPAARQRPLSRGRSFGPKPRSWKS